jgi:F-type H+-transporting ATPase subunit epsilon
MAKPATFLLKIISPEKILFSGDVNMATLPGACGEFSILSGHNSLVSALKAGLIKIDADEQSEIEIEEGFAQVDASNNEVVILIDQPRN